MLRSHLWVKQIRLQIILDRNILYNRVQKLLENDTKM